MKCEKQSYKTRQIAMSKLDEISEEDDRGDKPVRAYKCPHCEYWHLTSMAKPHKVTKRNISFETKPARKPITSLFIKSNINHENTN